ncbi:hypothetical protein IE53DRAFT_373338 [Violaceomyces palustris]|uniref:Uncharacterized protein n=1 Tax=Violaceomyces palustris TaxID=1673888 RepID=A0ACD0P4A7_9BASI|nr:hypothetical protein IE53DRAFT_373338 [Violaceomyces palustris]
MTDPPQAFPPRFHLDTSPGSTPRLLCQTNHPQVSDWIRQQASSSSSSSSSSPPSKDGSFWRRAKFSPDGSLILAQSESHRLDILRLEPSQPQHDHHLPRQPSTIRLLNTSRSPSPALDAIWYPYPAYDKVRDSPSSAENDDPSNYQMTWCYALSSRHVPIRLIDSSNAKVRASYAIMDHVERFIGPHSLAFSMDNTRLYCGENSQISIFNLASPGLNTHIPVPLAQSRSSSKRAHGQRGFVSCISVSSAASSPSSGFQDQALPDGDEIVAAGTFSGTVGLYLLGPSGARVGKGARGKGKSKAADGMESCIAGWREIEGCGVVQMAFHPQAQHVLFVSSRRSSHINVYDTRYLIGGSNPTSFSPLRSKGQAGRRNPALMARLARKATRTHQRIGFDIDWAGRWLCSGDAEGFISAWRIDQGRFLDLDEPEEEEKEEGEEKLRKTILQPFAKWKAHEDAIGSISFHPYKPYLMSVSGSRSWADSDSDSETEDESGQNGGRTYRVLDSSLKVWHLEEEDEQQQQREGFSSS